MDLNGFKQQIEALSLEEKIAISEHLNEEIKKESEGKYGNNVGFMSNREVDVDIEVMVNCLSASDLAAIFEALAQKTRKEKPFAE
ncbi:MAG: hypothetical protein J7647_00745 [Cyanobacteria bacterium SBLK]|nr:hypothetical protein [Cyanobacteria bacterium SBLK]